MGAVQGSGLRCDGVQALLAPRHQKQVVGWGELSGKGFSNAAGRPCYDGKGSRKNGRSLMG